MKKVCRLLLLLALAVLAADVRAQTKLEIANPSFEEGMVGHWTSSPGIMRVDTSRAARGAHSLRVAPGGGGDLTSGFHPPAPDMLYDVSFSLVGEEGKPLPRVGVQFLLTDANGPCDFWWPADRGNWWAQGKAQGYVMQWWKPTARWQRISGTFGPVGAMFRGHGFTGIQMYIKVDSRGQKNAGALWIDDISVTARPAPPPTRRATISIDLPTEIHLYTKTPRLAVRADDAPEAATLHGELRNFRGEVIVRAEGPPSEPLALKIPQTGYYAVKGELRDGGELLGSATTTLMVTTPLPPDYYETPHPAFGVWGVDLGEGRDAGMKWTRRLFWNQFEERDGPLPAEPPSAQELAQWKDVNVVCNLNVCNAFSSPAPLPREAWPQTLAYLKRAITRRKGIVDVWETQNEPMVGENFHGTMQDVMDIMRITAQAAREADPGTPVAGVCINVMHANQYGQYVGYYERFGAADVLDGVILHAYIPSAQSPDLGGFVEVLNRLAKDLERIAGKQVPMYITEMGYSTRPGGEVTELQQAAYLARTALLIRQVPALVGTVWHIGYTPIGRGDRERDYGILRVYKDSRLQEPKPAWVAWATVSRMTYDAEYLRELELGRNAVGLLFSRRGNPLLVLYTANDEPERVKIGLGGKQALLTDMCGSKRTVALQEGVLSLKIDAAPVYVEPDTDMLLREDAAPAVTFMPQELCVLAGETAELRVQPAGQVWGDEARLFAEALDGWEITVGRDGAGWRLRIAVPPAAAPGEVPLFIKVAEAGQIRHVWRRSLDVLAPIALGDPTGTFTAGGEPALRFTATTRSGWQDALMRVLTDDGRTVALTRIACDRETIVPLYDVSFGRPRRYEAQITLPDGYRYRVALPDVVAFAVPRHDVTVDGDVDDWPVAAWHDLGGGVLSRHRLPEGATPPRGRVALAWSPTHVFVAAEVEDEDHHPQSGSGLWGSDGLQISFRVPTQRLVRPNNIGIQETSYAEIGVSAAPEEPRSWNWASMNRQTLALHGPVPELQFRFARRKRVTVYEIAVPWATLGARVPMAAATRLGVSVLVNDDDGTGRHWLEWYSGIADGKDPSRFGAAVLVK